MLRITTIFTAVLALAAFSVDAGSPSSEQRQRAEAMIEKALDFLVSQQDASTGGWGVPPENPDGPPFPHFPGVSGLVLIALHDAHDPQRKAATAIDQGLDYVLAFQKPDGGIYDRLLPSYNTSLALSAIARSDRADARAAIRPAQDFLRSLQWFEDSDPGVGGAEASKPVPREHPFYGGVGYGRHGRPDNSNLNLMLQAMEDSGVSPDDPAVQRALVFLERTQMDDRINDMPYARGSRQGGFVYSTAEDAQSVDGLVGQSMAGKIEETLSDGTVASRLRAYGSMTYAGFKSYLYAQLPRDDIRVTAAKDWISRHYTLDENPGLGPQGQYYYYVTFARALEAWGEPTIETVSTSTETTSSSVARPDGTTKTTTVTTTTTVTIERNWANDLIDRLAELQLEDGSFRSVHPRWMEDNPTLITAYAVIALQHAIRE